ncbi:MAG TPA: helix-turn-helix transcriptional regulator [bacterium]
MARSANTDLLEAVGTIYQASMEPGQWSSAVDAIRRATRADSAFMLSIDVMPEQGGLLATANIDASVFVPQLADVLRDNPFIDAWNAKGAPSCQLFRAADLVNDANIEKWKMYETWVRPLKFHYAISTIVYEKQPFLTPKNNLNMLQEKDSREFNDADMEAMRTLMPHLQRSLLIHWRLKLHEHKQNAAQEVLDRLAMGVVLLNAEGRVTAMNAAADRVVRGGRTLQVRNNQVGAAEPAEASDLRELVTQVAATGKGAGVHPGGTVTLHGTDSDASLLVLATPLGTQRVDTRWLGDGVCAALFISDPEAKHPLSIELLQQWFGFTPAESQVAVDLMNGLDPAEISSRRHVSEETVRSQTKAIYEKAGVNRRGQLMHLLLTSPAAVMRDPASAKQVRG